MGRTVFILGAGASAQGGCPVMSNFLEVADRLRDSGRVESLYNSAFETVFKARAQLQSVHSKAELDLHNIESVFGAFEMAKRFRKPFGDLTHEEIERLGDEMRLLIVRTLELTSRFRWQIRHEPQGDFQVQVPFLIPPYPYADFAELVRKVRQKTPTTIITFNYDVGLDAALAFAKLSIDYCLQKEMLPGQEIPLIKLHGSINWGRCKNCNNEVVPWFFGDFYEANPLKDYNKKPYSCPSGPDEVYVEIGSAVPGYRHDCGTLLQIKTPAIVPPTWAKTEYNTGFDNMWAHAANQLAEAENIIVIGYSLPPTDQFFPILYALGTVSRTILKRFWVYDPDPDGTVEKRFQTMLGAAARQKFMHKRMKFSEAFGDLNDFAKAL
jgi:NAD-dependent SIR2 family protein deacetylase